MADSSITKKALAAALKKLMAEISFEKITISSICSECEMNRKSFYYHFKDKYDLVNRIYYTEFIEKTCKKEYKNAFEFLEDACKYLEENKIFYRKVLKYRGQNSFYEYFKESLIPVIENYTGDIFEEDENKRFCAAFFSEAFVNAVKKWLFDADAAPAEKFISMIHTCIVGAAKKVAEQKIK